MQIRHRDSSGKTLRLPRICWRLVSTLAGATAVAAGLAALLGSACSRDNAKPATATPAVSVKVVRVEPRPLEDALDITGSLVSSVAVEVKTEFAGRLVAMRKQEGDRVGRGELLAQLDDTGARLSVAQARASLDVAQAALDRARVGEQAARIEGERSENLSRSGGITQRDYQAAQVATHDTRAQVKLAEAQVEQVRQALAIAEKHLRDCRILAPIAGEVERKLANPGGWVDGNTVLYRLVDNQRLELQTFVASADLARLERGQKVRFTVATYGDEDFGATVLSIGAGVDPQSRSAPVRAAVPNPARKLKAGMFVKGRIVTGVKPSGLVVPLEAVWHRTGQPPHVFVLEQNRARRREVKLGSEASAAIEIVSGLKAGDVVVAEQNLEVADGVRVTPRP